MKLEKEFIPYEQALTLKKLGFDEPCLAIHSFIDNEVNFMYVNNFHTNNDVNELSATAPLYQQAFDWFRNKYQLDSFCRQFDLKGKSYWKITKIETVNKIKGYSNFSSSYKQSQLNCLKKLIKLCQK